MTLTVRHAGHQLPDTTLHYSFHIDDPAGQRIAESAGTVENYPTAERSPDTARWEALLAALEWLHPLALVRFSALRLPDCTGPDTRLLTADARPVLAVGQVEPGPPAHIAELVARCRAVLLVFRRRGPVEFGDGRADSPSPAARRRWREKRKAKKKAATI